MTPTDLKIALWTNIASLKILIKRIGVYRTSITLAHFLKYSLTGQPWKRLPPPADERERLSRNQAGPAVLLYQSLTVTIGPGRAFDLAGEAILAGSLIFLKSQVPIISREQLAGLSPLKRERFIADITGRFFNADVDDPQIGEDSFSYRVCRCRFPELLQKIGLPELGELFCRGDRIFFERYQPNVLFDRTVTLARDGKPCDFSFLLK